MSDQKDQPVSGDVYDRGGVRVYSWDWNDIGGPKGRSTLPWFGIFLVVFGGLLLLQLAFPALESAGSLLFLAVGVAFLVSWVVNRGVGSLYLGAIITALAAPGLLDAANVVSGAGVGTLCLGIAFLFIAVVRAASDGGWGWQVVLGAILFAIGLSSVAFPKLGDLIWPITILVLGDPRARALDAAAHLTRAPGALDRVLRGSRSPSSPGRGLPGRPVRREDLHGHAAVVRDERQQDRGAVGLPDAVAERVLVEVRQDLVHEQVREADGLLRADGPARDVDERERDVDGRRVRHRGASPIARAGGREPGAHRSCSRRGPGRPRAPRWRRSCGRRATRRTRRPRRRAARAGRPWPRPAPAARRAASRPAGRRAAAR